MRRTTINPGKMFDVSEDESAPPWTGSSDVLLHIGVHKTGTTALQGAFASARRELRRQGVVYPGDQVSHYFASLAALGKRRGWAQGGEHFDRRLWDELAEEVRSSSGRVVISSEALCEAGDAAARQVVEDLGGPRVRVVVTLRSLEKLLPSTWQQYVKAGKSLAFDSWLEAVMVGPGTKAKVTPSFWKRNDHARLVERWSRIVGPQRVCVVVVDPRDGEALFRSFESLIGLRHGTLRPDPHLPSNRSLSWPEVELIRSLNSTIENTIDWSVYNRFVRQGGTLDLVERRRAGKEEPALTLPAWAVERSREIGQAAVESIRRSGVHVEGDLAYLVPDDVPTRHPPEPVTSVPVDAVVATVNGIVAQEVGRNRRLIDRARRTIAAAKRRGVRRRR